MKNRGDQDKAIDGDLNTESYMTPSGPGANIWYIAGLDLSEKSNVHQIRIAKHRPDRDHEHFNKVSVTYSSL